MGHPSQKPAAVGTRQALVLGLALAVIAVVGLALAEAFHVRLLVDPVDSIGARGLAAWVGVGLLVADIVLPVPSSVVMLAHGALFGVIPGVALSLLGRTGNAVVGVLIGGAPETCSAAARGVAPPPIQGREPNWSVGGDSRRWSSRARSPSWPRARWWPRQPWGCPLGR